MTIEEDIALFRVWATKLGFPINDIPNENALKSIFKARQGDIFRNLMKKVQPRQVVDRIREAILLKKMEKHKDQVVPACSRAFLPKELQNYLKMEELKKKKADVEKNIAAHRTEYDSLSCSIKLKNIQCIKMRLKEEHLRAKVNLFQARVRTLQLATENETKIKELITINTPVKLKSTNANEGAASIAVQEAIKELELFYELHTKSPNPHNLQHVKENLWQKLRLIFGKIPNFLIYNSIVRLKEHQLQAIMDLSKDNTEDSHLTIKTSREDFTAVEKKLMNSKIELLTLAAKYAAAKNECEQLNEQFAIVYNRFVENVQKKLKLYSTDHTEEVDDIISDYIVQYNMRSFKKAQNDYLATQIEKWKELIEIDSRQLEDHEILLGSIKQVYSDINAAINRIQHDKTQLKFIKEKIIFSRNVCLQMMEHQRTPACPRRKLQMVTAKNADSFDTTDSLFSSTKLDFDSTTSSFNSTRTRQNFNNTTSEMGMVPTHHIIPSYTSEIHIFNDIPIEYFDYMNKDCSFYFSPNPMVTESYEQSSTYQMAPSILLTVNGALNELSNRIKWAESLKNISTELNFNQEIVTVDPIALKAKYKEQYETVAELIDQIDVVRTKTKQILKKAYKYYDFVRENPLRNYIPSSRKVNGQSYEDYESEYLMYYRIATAGNSIE